MSVLDQTCFCSRTKTVLGNFVLERSLNAVNLNFVAGAAHFGDELGWMYAAFAIAIAAAEVAIGLAILVVFFRNLGSIEVQEISKLKG